MVDYSKLSNEDLIKLNNNDYNGLSDEGLKILYEGEEIQPQNGMLQGGILTFDWDNAQDAIKTDPGQAVRDMIKDSNRRNPILQGLKGGLQGLSKLGIGLGKGLINEKIRPLLGKEPLTEEQIDTAYGWLGDKPEGLGKVSAFAGEMAPYFLLPEATPLKGAGFGAKIGNSALTNAYQGGLIGGLESLKNGGNLSGLGAGTVLGGTLGTTFPLSRAGISKLLPRAGASIAGVSTDTIQQAIKPNSKALDLNPDTAQALLYDTTQNVRNAYNNLLSKRGQAVNDAVEKLRGNQYRIPVQDLQKDITQTFDQYGGELINPARNMTRNLEDNLQELIASGGKDTPLQGLKGATDITEQTISPIDLEKAKQQIGNMINWSDETARNYQNPILEQIYGKYNSRLSNLSPELQAANESFANLRNFKNNEGLRKVLRPGDNIDSASSALKNYNSTVTKGNTGRNIQDLENILVANGEQPFLGVIDDINAAMDLNNSIGTGRNFGGITDAAKALLVEPALRGARAINRTGIPQQLNVLRENVPLSTVQMLYGLSRPFSE